MDRRGTMFHGVFRHRTLLTLLAALAYFGSIADPASAADPIAILASVRGEVRVVSAGTSGAKKGSFGQALYKGDRVSAAAEGSATIFFNDGNVVELGENSSATVGAGGDSRGKSDISGEVYSQVARYVTGGSRETGLVALSGMRAASEAAPMVLSPRRTSVMESRPTFHWRATPDATRYLVTLHSDDEELWRAETGADSLGYPEQHAQLAAGADFLWEVEARSDSRSLAKDSAVFHVISAEEAAAVSGALKKISAGAGSASAAGHYLAGSYLSGRGLYRDAAEQFRALVGVAPDSPDAHEALAGAYAAMGLMDVATEEYRRALSLARTVQP